MGSGQKERRTDERPGAELMGPGALLVPVGNERADIRMPRPVRFAERVAPAVAVATAAITQASAMNFNPSFFRITSPLVAASPRD
jgi:hypothetical protein